MRSSFFGLNTALSGLYTAQRSLDTVNHNVSNAATPGYTRQRVIQTAARPMPLFDGTGMIGTGADVTAVRRIRDNYYDFKFWNESVAYGEWETKSRLMTELEGVFNEPSESGFSRVIEEYYSSLQELSKDPGNRAVRAMVMQSGVAFTKYFNNLALNFEKCQEDLNFRTKIKVDEVNSYALQIQELNKQIYTAEIDGNAANDLRDRRTLLVDKLSMLVNIEAEEVIAGKLPDGRDDLHFQIKISGKTLVDHYSLTRLKAEKRTERLNPEDADGLYEIAWEDGNQLEIRGGELRGLLDVRDGNEGENGSPIYKGIPFYIKKLDQFARTFAMVVNEGYMDLNSDGVISAAEDGLGYSDGYSLNSAAGDVPSGIRFFTMRDTNGKELDSLNFIDGATTADDIYSKYKNITAKNFAVSRDILTNTDLISASSVAGEKGNSTVISAILSRRHDIHMFSEGAPEDFMKAMVSAIGIDSKQTIRFSENQKALLLQADNRRLAESGVSLDEEMADLVKYQHAYNAAAKMITTMAEIYDTLINRTGNIR